MSENSPKFNPAVLPAEYMEKFERPKAKEAALLPLSRTSLCNQRSHYHLNHPRILRRRLSLGPAQASRRNEPLPPARRT